MNQSDLISIYKNSPKINEFLEKISKTKSLTINGLAGSLKSIYISIILKKSTQNHFFIFQNKEDSLIFLNDLKTLNHLNTFFFSEKKQIEDSVELTKLLQNLEENQSHIIVSFADAISQKFPNQKSLKKDTYKLHENDELDLNYLENILLNLGFEQVDFTTKPGEFSIRGFIIDIFSFSNEEPYRIILSSNIIESIMIFDPENQLSTGSIKTISISPNIYNPKIINENYIFSYLNKDSIIWIENTDLIKKKIDNELNCEINNFSTINIIESKIRKLSNNLFFQSEIQKSFNKNINLLEKEIEDKKNTLKQIIVTQSKSQKKRFQNIFNNLTFEKDYDVIEMDITQGFIDYDNKISVYTDHEIFNRFHKKKIKRKFSNTASITLKELTKLEKGDYVTHYDHGVGIFDGLIVIKQNEKKQEVLKIKYKNEGVLYVSIHSIQKVSKFKSKNLEEKIKINELGNANWKKLKNNVKQKVKKLAFDLVHLYAERKLTKGFSYSQDSYLQNELESSFVFEDTIDQANATGSIKKDMENSFPMDRLICGDVGFGKTEIAIRAAFKAVTDNKQVCILVPTTVLAFQHYKTFLDRLKKFPCNIDYLNRFKSKKEITNSLQKMKNGQTDIIIGTHRLVSNDIKFKDLGLLIIDEEQKFGVSTKEKIRNIKKNVDTLTLSATPIPRTLQLSLMGARDISILKTPPPNRNPISTEIIQFDINKISEKIQYEIQRGGQVFFIHNRIKDIEDIHNLLVKFNPNININIGHGQMNGSKLEKVILEFMNGKFDVLLSTTIVGNGVDIPNANTIFINNAHQFGLSDIHQIRGRVGRKNKQAFCYLIAPPIESLKQDSYNRLTAIEKFSGLGDGFNIAMKDLEIRGAGDVLGAEQSGFINEIGFQTYQKILTEATEELKQEKFNNKNIFKTNSNCSLDTDLELIIPQDYIENKDERLYIYTQLSNLKNENELKKIEHELKDRFGIFPRELINLIKSIRLKWKGDELGFKKIILKHEKMIIFFPDKKNLSFYNSHLFMQILEKIKSDNSFCYLKEKNNQINLYINQKVCSINEAIEIVKSFK